MKTILFSSPHKYLAVLSQDTIFALRMMRKNVGFTISAVLTLALGIAATTIIFSAIDAVILRPLPYRIPERLVTLWNDFPGSSDKSTALVSGPDFIDYRQQSQLFEGIAGAVGFSVPLSGDRGAEMIRMAMVTADFFPLLGIDPVMGRHFQADEEGPNQPRIVLLNYDLWQTSFGGDPNIIGRTISLNGPGVTVIGVLPPDFQLLLPEETHPSLARADEIKAWELFQFDLATFPRESNFLAAIGRLNPEVSIEQARSEMEAIAARLRSEHAGHQNRNTQIRITPLQKDIVKHVRPSLVALFVAASTLLVIACANVANMLMARDVGRRREFAIRAAIGASRTRIMRQLMTENLLLAMIGGVIGLLLAHWGLDLLPLLQLENVPRLQAVALNAKAFGFAAAVCLLSVILFGLTPAFRSSRADLSIALKSSDRGASGSGWRSASRLLVILEVALCLVVLIGAGLLIQTFRSLYNVRPGFASENVLTFRTPLPSFQYRGKYDVVSNYYMRLEDRLAALPGVKSVGAVDRLPLTGTGTTKPFAFDAESEKRWGDLTAEWRTATPGYFQALGTRLMSGRFFTEKDDADAPFVAIVDENLARRAWPNENPVGKMLKVPLSRNGKLQAATNQWVEVVGVVETVSNVTLRDSSQPQVCLPFHQQPSLTIYMAVKIEGDPSAMLDAAQEAVKYLDKEVPVADVHWMDDYVSSAMSRERLSLALMSVFGILALGLAAVGVFGLFFHIVSAQTREVGIRLALGATPGNIFRRVIRQGMALALTGLLIGIATASFATGLLRNLLFGVEPTDWMTFAWASALLLAVAMIACVLPARKAMLVEPVEALRHE
ncbi:MAG: ABC transporter permease [Blastocatellia bacterium]|nr:ABC transporter permease [Blastocatellia bacterium]